MKTRFWFPCFVVILAFALPAKADVDKVAKWKRRAERLRTSCGNEVQKFCKDVQDGKEQYRCIFLKQSELSPACQAFVANIRQKIAAHKEKVKQEQQRIPASSGAKTGS